MSKPFQPTPHPVLRLPDAADCLALGTAGWQEALARREEIIRAEKNDPFRQCWEPPIWKVCDALLDFPWVDPVYAAAMRAHLGFARPVKTLLINGGQRGGKTQYACHRVLRILLLDNCRERKAASAWMLHSDMAMSRKYHQMEIHNYLPASFKVKAIKSETTYISFTQKNGFSDQNFVLPPSERGQPGSDCAFKTYEQDPHSIEGGNLDVIHADELVPSDWVETMKLRIAERNGWMLVTFTPVAGYSETVKLFQDGAETVKESTAFLCPKDGGPPDLARALGLTEKQLEDVQAAAESKPPRAALYPQSVPENCALWLEGRSGQMDVPAGREFETVPRVMKCVDPERAVVFFHSSDNPYGNPKNVWGKIASGTREFIKERFYGVAFKQMAGRFPKFNLKVHVVSPEEIPARGTNYLFIDPCSGRNFYMLWIRVTPEQVFVYREWPGPYYIKGQGVVGPWALPDGKRPDGRMGPAQDTFGWGYRKYKEQIADLEGWHDAKKEKPSELTEDEWLDSWDEQNGAEEPVEERKIDARFASSPKLENDRPRTLITDFEDILLFLKPARGEDIAHGIQKINDYLHYDDGKPVDYFNRPKLVISRDCPNLIFALLTWTGKDGQKGATKDPIETLYRFATDDCPYLGDAGAAEEEESEFTGASQNYY